MECNRDEAIRARDIAEKKFALHDFVSAKKFLLKAQQLFPALEGVLQWLAVLDVHIVAQVKVGSNNNETDWYGILQVEPSSDDNTIKKQYRKLALMLHPDKNKSLGAEAAFKMIGEAFGVLSDRGKRALHDVKRGGVSKVSHVPTHVPEPSRPSHPAYHAQYQAAAQATPPAPGAQALHPSLTFWTSCPLCRMQYQYLRTYLNYQLLCQKCHKPFHARDINAELGANGAAPFPAWTPRSSFDNNGPISAGPVPPAPKRSEYTYQSWPRGNGAAGGMAANGHGHVHGDSRAAGVGNKAPGATAATAAAAAANLVHEAYRKAHKDRVDAERELKRKDREREKLVRQQEKEAIKKARDAAKLEAFQRLLNKRKESVERKGAQKDGTRKRLNKRRREDEDDDDEDDDEDESEPDSSGRSRKSNVTRRSSRSKRNVAYGLNGSDDEDFAAIPESKKLRMAANGGDVGSGSRAEKGKSVMDDDEDEIWVEKDDAGGGYVKDKRSSGSVFVNDTQMLGLLAEAYRKELAAKLRRIPGLNVTQQGDAGKGFNAKSAIHLGNSSFCNGKSDRSKEFDANVNRMKHTNQEAPYRTHLSHEPENEAPSSLGPEEEPISVPDPDFHDFDADRTEAHVKKNQVWAVFDETDGMPRFYCQVTKVRRTPFTVYGSWLEPIHPQKDTFHWLNERDLSMACGEFQLGDEADFDQINMFSHLMPIKRYKNIYEVYPKRSEVWAIYRDYEKDVPKSNADGRVQFRYDFVEIKSDFSAVTGGGSVVALEKLQGYKTLWVPRGDMYRLSVRNDLIRFSHRVPALRVTEGDMPGVPADCLELDPASTPADDIGPTPADVARETPADIASETPVGATETAPA